VTLDELLSDLEHEPRKVSRSELDVLEQTRRRIEQALSRSRSLSMAMPVTVWPPNRTAPPGRSSGHERAERLAGIPGPGQRLDWGES
jgi:hypothetical protein